MPNWQPPRYWACTVQYSLGRCPAQSGEAKHWTHSLIIFPIHDNQRQDKTTIPPTNLRHTHQSYLHAPTTRQSSVRDGHLNDPLYCCFFSLFLSRTQPARFINLTDGIVKLRRDGDRIHQKIESAPPSKSRPRIASHCIHSFTFTSSSAKSTTACFKSTQPTPDRCPSKQHPLTSDPRETGNPKSARRVRLLPHSSCAEHPNISKAYLPPQRNDQRQTSRDGHEHRLHTHAHTQRHT